MAKPTDEFRVQLRGLGHQPGCWAALHREGQLVWLCICEACEAKFYVVGDGWQEGTDTMMQPCDWPTGSSVDYGSERVAPACL